MDANESRAPVLDARLPRDMALACEAAGAAKASWDSLSLFVLGLLAGAFIAFGALFMTVVLTGTAEVPWGLARLAGGIVFSLGLILVIAGGAELFTGDALMVVAFASGRIGMGDLLRAWSIVYAGNILGSLGMVLLMFLAGHHGFAGGSVGRTALTIATAKAALPTGQLFVLAVLCNVLVCLGVWMSFGARSTIDKVAVIVPPVAAFVAAGFEHSIANLYLLAYALAIKTWAAPEFWSLIKLEPAAFAALTPVNVLHNVIIATIGNLAGGSLLVGVTYWFVYLRKR